MENLFQNHIETILQFPSPMFLKLVQSLEDGIKSDELSLSSQICGALDSLCTFYYERAKKNDQNAQLLQKHLQNSNLFPRILAQLFNIVIFEECGNQWSISRTMLSLIVINPSVCTSFIVTHYIHSFSKN